MIAAIIIILGIFFALGFAIASSFAKNGLHFVIMGILFGFGLMFLTIGVVFAGCVLSMNGGHLVR